MNAIRICGSTLGLVLVTTLAHSQATSEDSRVTCEIRGPGSAIALASYYLEGEGEVPKTPLVTKAGGVSLKLNGAAVPFSVAKGSGNALVTIPFVSTKRVKVNVEIENSERGLPVSVCEFFRKTSAAWNKFTPDDLKAGTCRLLSGLKKGAIVTALTPPPAGYADSRVLVVRVSNLDEDGLKATVSVQQEK